MTRRRIRLYPDKTDPPPLGYRYDCNEDRWVERTAPRDRYSYLARHGDLMTSLLREVGFDDSPSDVKLYAMMLARALVMHNVELMEEFGKQIGRVSNPQGTLPIEPGHRRKVRQ